MWAEPAPPGSALFVLQASRQATNRQFHGRFLLTIRHGIRNLALLICGVPSPIHPTTFKEKSMATKEAVGKPVTKSQTLQVLAEATELSRKQVAAVFDELANLIDRNLGKKGPGVFVVPGLLKLKVVHKPARPARKGINPFTKQEQMFKAKPARNVVKAIPLKALKDMVK
jgi:nucleoid DNA-binding protein